ncbi:hypothetical protein K450DRAFT_179731, partial [Umbelopsis ramanniana AG]
MIRAADGNPQEISVGRWSDEDLEKLLQLVDEHSHNGTIDWDGVAAKFSSRTKEQCRNEYRYHQTHCKEIPQFSQEEDEKLVRLAHKYQERWDLIAKELPGRNVDECRIRWNKYTKWKQDENRRS